MLAIHDTLERITVVLRREKKKKEKREASCLKKKLSYATASNVASIACQTEIVDSKMRSL